jgi:two-component system, LytTR family, response regulator
MIRCIIIDDEPSAINVLSMLLKKNCHKDVEVIATSNSPSEGRLLVEQHTPDLVFLDIEMPGSTGIDLVRSFSAPTFRFVFVTAYDVYAVEAFRLCAVDYLLKPLGAEDVIGSIEKIKRDISRDRSDEVQIEQIEKRFAPGTAVYELLTKREQELITLLAQGFRYKEIADKMFISTETVRKHTNNIYTKLQVQSRMEAINKVFGEIARSTDSH